MLDPLSPSTVPPPWPSSPHHPQDIPARLSPSPARSGANQQDQVRRTPLQRNEPSTSSTFEKERQVYGQPSASLMSPNFLMDGKRADKLGPFLRVKISGMERNRKDLLIRFDASTNLTHYSRNLYKNMQRSYVEFRLLADQLTIGNPQTIVAALPLPQSSALTDEEDDRLVRIAIQRWFSRICEDLVLLQDEELQSFIESDFGYNPVPRSRKKTASAFPIQLPLLGKGPHDEDEELATAKTEIAKLDTQFAEAAKVSDKLSKSRKSLAASEVDMGVKLVTAATTEQVPSLGLAIRKLGRALDAIAGIQHVQAANESVVIGDTLGYQSLNARSAKETLSQRTHILEEYSSAAKITITKRRAVERLKGSSSMASSKVDDAIAELNEAKEAEDVIYTRLENISKNLHRSLQTHSRQAHEDIAVALVEHARMNVLYERSILKELEALRPNIKGITNTGVRRGLGVHSPSVLDKPLPTPQRQPLPPTRSWVEQPRPQAPLSSSSTYQPSPTPSFQHSPQPYRANHTQAPPYQGAAPSYPTHTPSVLPSSTSTSYYSNNVLNPPSLQVHPQRQPDLTQSMYNPPPSSTFTPPPRNGTTQPAYHPSSRIEGDPLSGGGPVYSSANAVPQVDRGTGGGHRLSQSFYQAPTSRNTMPQRKKLDPREAARQLANGF